MSDLFHFNLNGTIYTCKKVPKIEDYVIIIGTKNVKNEFCNINYPFEYIGENCILFRICTNENVSKTKEVLSKDLNTVFKEDILFFDRGPNAYGMKAIAIQTTSEEEYISPSFSNFKPAKR